jgi:hypothetical protein
MNQVSATMNQSAIMAAAAIKDDAAATVAARRHSGAVALPRAILSTSGGTAARFSTR